MIQPARTRSFLSIAHAIVFVLLAVRPAAGADSFLATFLQRTAVLPKQEIRAAWVVRYSLESKEEVDRAVDYAVRARFHLLFVQVRGRADAYYRSTLEPEGLTLRRPVAEFDPLEYLLQRCHESGIAVHAWVNTLLVWSDGESKPPAGHIAAEHPDWLVTDIAGVRMDERPLRAWLREGQTGYFVSPARPEVRRHIASVVGELVGRYPVDGIHLDYIRYPGPQFDFGPAERTAFTLRYGVDPLSVAGRGRGEPLESDRWLLEEPGAAQYIDSLRVEWRAAQVESVVVAVRRAAGDLPCSAAVLPEPERARVDEGQDWVGWVQRGLVDFVVPMAYSYEPGQLVRFAERLRRTTGLDRVLMGLPVFDGRERYLGYSVSLLRREGVVGYSLFSQNELQKEPFSIQFIERVFLGPEADGTDGDGSGEPAGADEENRD